MLATGFHARGRDRPDSAVKIELLPPRAKHLARPCSREDRKFKRESGGCLPRLQIRHKGRQVVVAHCRVMAAREPLALWQELVQVPAPTCWILAAAQTLPLRSIKHAFDSTTE